jgi:transcriptional regulator NrdR family protein
VVCPSCGSCLVSVIESRHASNDVVARKRRCLHCGNVWPTAEVTLPSQTIRYKKVMRLSGVHKGRIKPEFSLSEEALLALTTLRKNLVVLTSDV